MRRKDGLPQNRPRIYDYGITWRQRRKPWFVKFKRDKRQIVVGSFITLREARAAALEFLRNEVMTLPTSLRAYPDCEQLWDAALADPSGARGCSGTYDSAINMRSRMHYYRNLLRKQNKELYPPEHHLHGTSVYDHLYVQIIPDEDGQYWLYVQPRDGKLLAIEGLSDTPPLIETTATEIAQIEDHSEELPNVQD